MGNQKRMFENVEDALARSGQFESVQMVDDMLVVEDEEGDEFQIEVTSL